MSTWLALTELQPVCCVLPMAKYLSEKPALPAMQDQSRLRYHARKEMQPGATADREAEACRKGSGYFIPADMLTADI